VDIVENAMGVLSQLLVFSLFIERTVEVASQIFLPGRPSFMDVPRWGRWHVAFAFLIALLIFGNTNFDLLTQLAGGSPDNKIRRIFDRGVNEQVRGVVSLFMASAVTAGGSVGIRQMVDVLLKKRSAAISEAKRRVFIAQSHKSVPPSGGQPGD